MEQYDAAVIGAGPNGLAAAIALAAEGSSVVLLEAADEVGGGCRTSELTLPGYRHDVCAASHPFGKASPFLASLPLEDYGLEWVQPEIPLAHPLDNGKAGVLYRDVTRTAAALGPDRGTYSKLMGPVVANFDAIKTAFLGPLIRIPKHPLTLARFGVTALRSSEYLTRRFHRSETRALIAGLAGHSIVPLDYSLTAGMALALGAAGHVAGFPFAKGGSQAIVDAMAAHLTALGGEIRTSSPVASFGDLPRSRVQLFDLTPTQVAKIAGDAAPQRFRRTAARFRHGSGAFKVDWALNGPIPWRSEECRRAGVLHVGGTFEQVAQAEAAVWAGEHPEQPFLILAQPTVFDPGRAPKGKHIAWAYCHVPHGSTVDMTDRIEAQVERFAPGFRDLIAARHTMSSADFEAYNANYIGGDIAGGAMTFRQIIARPTASPNPYATPMAGVYLCSASTPPGAGVHGMCGYHAARSALRYLRRTG